MALARHHGRLDPQPRGRRGLFGGLLILVGWPLSLATGPQAYAGYIALLASLPGRAVLFALTVALFFHMAAGVRHLAWDIGKGFAPRTASATAWLAFAVSLVAAIALWAFALGRAPIA